MKQRQLTQQQYKLLLMQKQGYEKWQIAEALAVHIKTIDCKLRDIRKGMAKNAYIMPPELKSPQIDIFNP